MDPKNNILTSFGARVRERRMAKGLSQEALAHECGFDRTYISGIELGKRNVSLKNIKILAEAFEVSISDLFEGIL